MNDEKLLQHVTMYIDSLQSDLRRLRGVIKDQDLYFDYSEEEKAGMKVQLVGDLHWSAKKLEGVLREATT